MMSSLGMLVAAAAGYKPGFEVLSMKTTGLSG
jgi:hypothetical protein